VSGGEKNLYVYGGQRIDKNFLATLVLPAGMRALLYSNLDPTFEASALSDASGPVAGADRLANIVGRVQQQNAPAEETIAWSADPADREAFSAIPLRGRNGDLLGIFLVGASWPTSWCLFARLRFWSAAREFCWAWCSVGGSRRGSRGRSRSFRAQSTKWRQAIGRRG
jgi:hypothetical protein